MAVYRCAGSLRDTCKYEAPAPWSGPCPGCGRFYNVIKYGVSKADRKRPVTAADALLPSSVINYLPSGIDNFDHVLGGGLVKGQVILFGAPMGTGKTRFAFQLCQSLVGLHEDPVVYVSREETTRDLLPVCKAVGATSDRVRIYGSDDDLNVHDILQICDEVKPLLLVLDSLQAVNGWSTQNTETILAIMERCNKTGMIALVMNHMGKDLDFKGGTTVGHAVKTMLTFYQYDPPQDGKMRDLFGKAVANRVEDREFLLTDMRTMISGKNRSGGSGRKAFFFFNKEGRLEPLTVQAPKPRLMLFDGGKDDE